MAKMIDLLDERLCQIMGQCARQNIDEIAKQLTASPSTIRRRIRELIRSGVLRLVGVVDPSKIGFPLAAVIAFNVSHDKLNQAMEVLASRPEVKWASTTTGRFDVIALTWFRSTDELSQFLQEELACIEGFRDSETFVCLNVQKGRYVTLSATATSSTSSPPPSNLDEIHFNETCS
jgi:Lrp/AsnC family transcriptional regulator for asnA, asnC and gidA